jgi:predicted amidohydrolase YtcJ
VKAFADGAFGPRTAWLSSPYSDETAGSGGPVGDDRVIAERLASAAGAGLAPAVHAIGDRGLARALGMVAPWTGDPDRPPARIEHAALTPPELLTSLASVRPFLVVQPGFLLSDHWLGRRLGRDRARWAYAFRTLIDHGLSLAGSSDAPFDPLDPWRGIRAAVRRSDAWGRSANPSPLEALTAEEALGLYTRSAAGALGDPTLGHLEAGAPGNLVVLDTPNLEGALSGDRVPVAETWVEGKRLFDRGAPARSTTV